MNAPQTIEEYVQAVRSAVPEECIHDALCQIQCIDPLQLVEDQGESLRNWMQLASRRKGKIALTLVLGETLGPNLKRRKFSYAPKRGFLTAACTSDGAAGSEAVMGLLRQSGLAPSNIDYAGRIDEWAEIGHRLNKSHLIVIGTPEVNVVATFLNGLVYGCHFGDDAWPIRLHTMRNHLVIDEQDDEIARGTSEGNNNAGLVFLIRNPWNPNFRLLWVAGLTGLATRKACEWVAGDWTGFSQARFCRGVVFITDPKDSQAILPHFWARCAIDGHPMWRHARFKAM